ncbi:radical SAM protein [Deferribacteraceae bacterium V6Fe1]|nr:radical SAM protein [Deferribacteraceae bacterium V6Fe1]
MSFVFGPVPSRRLGVSLGVDIVPRKYCTLDCIYCEVCKTDNLTIEQEDYYDINEIINEVKEKYLPLKDSLDVVTITGSGEPTLNKSIDVIVKKLKTFVTHPIALLTNSTLFYDEEVRQKVKIFDIIVPSLDAANEKIFKKINKPSKEINFRRMIEGLITFSNEYRGKLILEILLLEGVNDHQEHLDQLVEIIKNMKYDIVQLNTAFRPTAYKNVKRLDDIQLLDIALFFNEKGLKVEPVKNFISKNISKTSMNDIFNKMLNMRPLSENDIIELFGETFLKNLSQNTSLEIFKYNGETFFKKI